MDKIQILLGDCMNVLHTIPSNSIHLVITSPPYNVNLGHNKYNKTPYNTYNDSKDHFEYINWLKDIFQIIKEKLVDGGRVCINIGDGKNGAVPTHSDIIQFMLRDLGYELISTIIWNKNQASPRTAWGSWLSPSQPSYPCPFEYILIFSKGSRCLQHTGISDLTKEEFINNAYALWTFAPERDLKSIGHPAVFPIELPTRLIKMNTYIGDTVLDPFMGSGTTGVACINTNRNFIGIEMDVEYHQIAKARLQQAQKYPGTEYKKPTPATNKKLF
jgi:site-specific DNA-methyltransferase (adenine-specific)